MKLPSVKELQVAGKTVLLRTNYDVPLRLVPRRGSGLRSGQALQVVDTTRIEESIPTIEWLLDQKSKVIIVSHLGRPEGRMVPELSLRPVARELERLLGKEVILVDQVNQVNQNLVMLENLRFYPGEEANDENFAEKLANLGDFYVNEAFAVCHRRHASIVGVPRLLPSAFGFDCLEEIEKLTVVRDKPKRPVVVLLGGVKRDKVVAAQKLVEWADWILIGGKLVEYNDAPQVIDHPKVVGRLIKDGQDITMETVEEFKKIIARAKTIIWAGPMGNFYDSKHIKGTKEIAKAVVASDAYTVVGGGDTEAALSKFGLEKKINFVSSGGGAMLEFLANGRLPGIEAIIK